MVKSSSLSHAKAAGLGARRPSKVFVGEGYFSLGNGFCLTKDNILVLFDYYCRLLCLKTIPEVTGKVQTRQVPWV